jgi:hypothetical protein
LEVKVDVAIVQSPAAIQEDFVTRSMLRSRGWTETAIREFLPPPAHKTDWKHPQWPPVSVWAPQAVAAVENSPEWEQWLGQSLRRQAVRRPRPKQSSGTIPVIPVVNPRYPAAMQHRFWAKVSKEVLGDDGEIYPAPPHPLIGTACWIWTGGQRFMVSDGQRIVPHRLAMLLSLDEVPDDFWTWQMHQRCGDTRCVNPGHLVLKGQWRRLVARPADYPPIFEEKPRPQRTPKPVRPDPPGTAKSQPDTASTAVPGL